MKNEHWLAIIMAHMVFPLTPTHSPYLPHFPYCSEWLLDTFAHSTGKSVKTVDLLIEETGVSVKEIAQRTGLNAARIEAIALGRWTPSPRERSQIAQALGVRVSEISWGHTMVPRNVRYHRFGLKEDF